MIVSPSEAELYAVATSAREQLAAVILLAPASIAPGEQYSNKATNIGRAALRMRASPLFPADRPVRLGPSEVIFNHLFLSLRSHPSPFPRAAGREGEGASSL